MNLFLDDERTPAAVANYMPYAVYRNLQWETVKSFDEFVKFINTKGVPENISFDHDLCDEHYKYSGSKSIPYELMKEKTGYHCLFWLILYCNKNNRELPNILIHTMNVTGKRNMDLLIEMYSKIK